MVTHKTFTHPPLLRATPLAQPAKLATTLLGSLLAVLGASNAHAAAGDADSDGVADAADLFPCDGSVASLQAIPAQNQFTSLYFEDQWPSQGDYDFNDFIVDQSFEIYKDGTGKVKQIRVIYHPRAYGALFDNGFALQLPINIGDAANAQITRKIGVGPAVAVNPRSGQARLVIDAARNIRNELFAAQAGQINTLDSVAVVNGNDVEINITFANPVAMSINNQTFDTFIFRSNDERHEIHLSQFLGTSTVRLDLFGTLNDGSFVGLDRILDSLDFVTGEMGCVTQSLDVGHCYVDARGVPFALELPTSAKFTKEGTRLDNLFPDIVGFGGSGGTQNQNFFNTNVRNEHASTRVVAAAPNVTALSGSISCVVPLGQQASNPAQSCLAILQAGASTGDGLYFLDPDGAGAIAPFQAFCLMSEAGGGWTRVARLNGAGYCNGSSSPNAGLDLQLSPSLGNGKMSDGVVQKIVAGSPNNQVMYFTGLTGRSRSMRATMSAAYRTDTFINTCTWTCADGFVDSTTCAAEQFGCGFSGRGTGGNTKKLYAGFNNGLHSGGGFCGLDNRSAYGADVYVR